MELYVDSRPLTVPDHCRTAAEALDWGRAQILKDQRVVMEISVDGIPLDGPDAGIDPVLPVRRIDIATAPLDETAQDLMHGFAEALPILQERAAAIADRLRTGEDLGEAWEACANLFEELPWAVDGLANLNAVLGSHFSPDIQDFAESWIEAFEAEDNQRLADLLEEELARWLEDNTERIERLRGALREN